ncbi:MAG: DUF4097 family beta strand repeat-containing protein [Bryobacteraceae bacterium]
MRRGSLIGPLLLIVVGLLFLASNLRPELPILELIGMHWPWVLIGWGFIRVAEITLWHTSGKPLPVNGVSGGEWTLVVFLCLLGSSVFYAHHYRDRINVIGFRGLEEVLGESHDVTHKEVSIAAGKTPRVLIESFRGDARIVGADTETVKASGRSTVRALSQKEAGEMLGKASLEVVRQGDLIVIRTNQDRLDRNRKVQATLEIAVPRGASLEARGRYGDFDISDLAGNVSVDSDNAGVRASNIGGNVRVDTRRGDIVRAQNVKGTVELRGGGEDIELDTVAGTVMIEGRYSGEIKLRALAKAVRVQESNTEFRAESVPGQIVVGRGNVDGTGLTGPSTVRARSRDVSLRDCTGSISVEVERGDVELRPGRLPLAKVDVRTKSGDIRFEVPEGAAFSIKGSSPKGEVDNQYGAPLEQNSRKIEGKVGTGPEVTLTSERGRIVVSKGEAGKTPVSKPGPATSL